MGHGSYSKITLQQPWGYWKLKTSRTGVLSSQVEISFRQNLRTWITYRKQGQAMLKLSLAMTRHCSSSHPSFRLIIIASDTLPCPKAQGDIIHGSWTPPFCCSQIPPSLLLHQFLIKRAYFKTLFGVYTHILAPETKPILTNASFQHN